MNEGCKGSNLERKEPQGANPKPPAPLQDRTPGGGLHRGEFDRRLDCSNNCGGDFDLWQRVWILIIAWYKGNKANEKKKPVTNSRKGNQSQFTKSLHYKYNLYFRNVVKNKTTGTKWSRLYCRMSPNWGSITLFGSPRNWNCKPVHQKPFE